MIGRDSGSLEEVANHANWIAGIGQTNASSDVVSAKWLAQQLRDWRDSLSHPGTSFSWEERDALRVLLSMSARKLDDLDKEE